MSIKFETKERIMISIFIFFEFYAVSFLVEHLFLYKIFNNDNKLIHIRFLCNSAFISDVGIGTSLAWKIRIYDSIFLGIRYIFFMARNTT